MRKFSVTEKKSASIVIGVTYKPDRMKRVTTVAQSVKIQNLSNREFNALMKILEKHSHTSRTIEIKPKVKI